VSATLVASPTSRLRFGLGRIDITPPVGIYKRLWGAPTGARHRRAPAVDGSGQPFVRSSLDLCGLAEPVYQRLAGALAEAAGVPRDRVSITFSHTHSAGWLFPPERFQMAGGELLGPYLQQLEARLRAAGASAVVSSVEAVVSYRTGRCDLAANRDHWHDARGRPACCFNPDAPADDTVTVARVQAVDGRALATLVHYACHPTTLAWQNSLLSPDYVGAMRETVEAATGAPCVFLLGAWGELAPRRGFVGDPAVADANGRQLGHAALSALAGLLPPLTDLGYDGAVLSGATLATWSPRPLSDERADRAARFAGGSYAAELLLTTRPRREDLEAELVEWQARQGAADDAGDAAGARDHGAMVERLRRWLGRLDDLPDGETLSLPFAVHRLGDALGVTCAGEPYSWLTAELRRRRPDDLVLLSPLAGLLHVAYLLPRASYGRGLYQEEPSILAPGCLELLADEIAARASQLP